MSHFLYGKLVYMCSSISLHLSCLENLRLKTNRVKDPLYVHHQSCYLFGRERRVADIPTDHPSCSKQHSVLQNRQVEEENPDGGVTKRERPYIFNGSWKHQWDLGQCEQLVGIIFEICSLLHRIKISY
ncbi:uncharacterized protein LOC121784317 [Salvia splendens]|uniref:uncharacterized protein LOC121784317 n=1 Tax=Salvia splendens TaxID=180675 RepID=UPI001C2548CF|nr:uncharacterized protein LOC121784317 [Salvia splendens]